MTSRPPRRKPGRSPADDGDANRFATGAGQPTDEAGQQPSERPFEAGYASLPHAGLPDLDEQVRQLSALAPTNPVPLRARRAATGRTARRARSASARARANVGAGRRSSSRRPARLRARARRTEFPETPLHDPKNQRLRFSQGLQGSRDAQQWDWGKEVKEWLGWTSAEIVLAAAETDAFQRQMVPLCRQIDAGRKTFLYSAIEYELFLLWGRLEGQQTVSGIRTKLANDEHAHDRQILGFTSPKTAPGKAATRAPAAKACPPTRLSAITAND